jgi:hypothetical protein
VQLAHVRFATAILCTIACRGPDAAPGQTVAPTALIVRHATVFDPRRRTTFNDRAIVIRGDRIVQVVADSAHEQIVGAEEIDAKGQLVTPGIIDVHHHSAYVFPDSITPGGAVSKLIMRPDSIVAYRARWAKSYLPFGVTAAVWARTRHELGPELPGAFYYGILEHFNELGPDNPEILSLINELAKRGATVTPTLHIFAQRVGAAPFTTKSLGAFDRSSSWTAGQRTRAARGYEILAGYVRQMYQAGIPLAVGSDWLEPGRVCLSEIVLLVRAGIPAPDALAIATLGGAVVIERDSDYGAIEAGRKAQLVIFERNPLEDIEAVFAGKTVIKDGVVVATH